jgi:hypothetical protein
MFLLQGPREPFVQAAVPPQPPQLTAVAASLFDQLVVDFVGEQIWQVFVPLAAPLPMKVAPIQHPVWQLPPLQIMPLPHEAPLPSCVQEVADDEGWHVRQAFAALAAPVAKNVPVMKHPLLQVPALQNFPVPPHPVPSADVDHEVGEESWQV